MQRNRSDEMKLNCSTHVYKVCFDTQKRNRKYSSTGIHMKFITKFSTLHV